IRSLMRPVSGSRACSPSMRSLISIPVRWRCTRTERVVVGDRKFGLVKSGGETTSTGARWEGNFARLHKTLRTTPAMAAGIENRLWSLEELVERTMKYRDLEYSVADNGNAKWRWKIHHKLEANVMGPILFGVGDT